jgi:hypothetical protein
MFGCDLISYGLILLSLWICVLMVLARESIFRLGYFYFKISTWLTHSTEFSAGFGQSRLTYLFTYILHGAGSFLRSYPVLS